MKNLLMLIFMAGNALFMNVWSQSVPNGDFEKWISTPYSQYENPENWKTSNNECEPKGLEPNVWSTSDAYSGRYALKLETGFGIHGEPVVGSVFCKAAIPERPAVLSGYYKVDLKQADQAGILVYLETREGILGYGKLILEKSTNQYTPFTIPIQYFDPTGIPDSIRISIHSSLGLGTPGTHLIIDALSFEPKEAHYLTLSEEPKTILRPSPAVDELLVQVPASLGEMNLRIYDGSGQMIESESFELQIRLDVYGYTPGVYMYEIRTTDHQLYDTGRFVVSCLKDKL